MPSGHSLSELAFSVEIELASAVPRSSVIRALRECARDFCIRTESWIGRFHYLVEKDLAGYDAAGMRDAVVQRILSVRLRRKNEPEELASETKYHLCNVNTVLIDPRLRKDYDGGTIDIVSVLVPSASGGNPPPEIIERYRDGLVYGACARLARQKGRPWFDPQLAAHYADLCNEDITRAIAETIDDNETESPGFSG